MDGKLLLDAVLHSPQLLGIIMTVVASNINNLFDKMAAPDAKMKANLQIVYLALSGLVYLLDQYMNGGIGSIGQDAIKNALDVWTAMVTTHFLGGAAVDKAKPQVAKLKAKLERK